MHLGCMNKLNCTEEFRILTFAQLQFISHLTLSNLSQMQGTSKTTKLLVKCWRDWLKDGLNFWHQNWWCKTNPDWTYRVSVWLQFEDWKHRVEDDVVGRGKFNVLVGGVSAIDRDLCRIVVTKDRLERRSFRRRIFWEVDQEFEDHLAELGSPEVVDSIEIRFLKEIRENYILPLSLFLTQTHTHVLSLFSLTLSCISCFNFSFDSVNRLISTDILATDISLSDNAVSSSKRKIRRNCDSSSFDRDILDYSIVFEEMNEGYKIKL